MENNKFYREQKAQIENSGATGKDLEDQLFNLWWMYVQHYNPAGVL